MPLKTTYNIIWRYKTTGTTTPIKRGGQRTKYDSQKIADFVFSLLSNPLYSNYTLEEIQQQIFKNKGTLLISDSVPSISWLENLLKCKLFHSKPMTLKVATVEPICRNSENTLQARFEYVSWITSLSVSSAQQLIFVDEHGYNLCTVKKRARSVQGKRASVAVQLVKSQNVTVTLAVSPTYGKIFIQILQFPTTKDSFSNFLSRLHNAWVESSKIPQSLKSSSPIIVLDNLRAHFVDEEHFQYKFLPKYSPFLNLAEPCNRSHKQYIRQYQRQHVDEILPYLEQLQWGEKLSARIELLRKIGHYAWKQISDQTIHNLWHHNISHYFPLCENKLVIHQ